MRTISYVKRWTRESVQADPDRIYLFGDNWEGTGRAGQACIRGLPNAIGIPTKRFPATHALAYLSDESFKKAQRFIDDAFARIPEDAHIVLPEDGLGTGLAELPRRAPRLYAYLLEKVAAL